jgi:hypothetical protein
MTTNTQNAHERWQARYARTLTGIVLTGVRRRGRGAWRPAAEAPDYVKVYCTGEAEPQAVGGGALRTHFASLAALRDAIAKTREEATQPQSRVQRARFPELELYALLDIGPPRRPALPPKVRGKGAIRTFADLCRHFGADETVASLNHRVYKDTDCGASVSVYGTYKGEPAQIHAPGDVIRVGADTRPALVRVPIVGALPPEFAPESFTIQTIIEGSDATVDSDPFYFGRCTTADVDAWVTEMDAEADFRWREANEDEDADEWFDADHPAVTDGEAVFDEARATDGLPAYRRRTDEDEG